MNTTLEFRNGMAKLILKPDDEWEQRLLGAIAKDGVRLDAMVEYKPMGHFSNQRAEVVEILLSASDKCTTEPGYDLQDKGE